MSLFYRIGIVEEGKYHEGTIKFIQYSPNGKLMLVGDSNCYYCIYDTTRNYQPVKALPRNDLLQDIFFFSK